MSVVSFLLLASPPDLSNMSAEVMQPIARSLNVASMTDAPEAWGELGQRYLAHELYVEAAQAFSNAERADPSEPQWSHLSGYTAALAGDHDDAIAAYRRALASGAGDATRLRLARLLEDRDADAARMLYEICAASAARSAGLGRLAAAAGDHASAIPYFRAALAEEPGADQLHYLIGLSLRASGDDAAAREHFALRGVHEPAMEDAWVAPVAAYALNPATYLSLARYALGYHNATGVLEALEAALFVDPQLAEAWALKVDALLLVDRPAEARDALARRAALEGDGPDALLARADQLYRLEGERALLDLLVQVPREPPARLRASARLLLRAGRAEEAADAFRALADAGGAEELADRYHLGLAHYRSGDCERALDAFDRALLLSPSEGSVMDAYARTAATCTEVGAEQRARALTLARQLYRARPGPGFAETLAMALAGEGQLEDAARLQRQIVDWARSNGSPELPRLTANLGRFQSGQLALSAWDDDDPIYAPPLD